MGGGPGLQTHQFRKRSILQGWAVVYYFDFITTRRVNLHWYQIFLKPARQIGSLHVGLAVIVDLRFISIGFIRPGRPNVR